MRQLRIIAAFCFLFFAPLCCLGQPVPPTHLSLPQEPTPNLGKLKTKLLAYHDCTAPTCYAPSLNHQADLAIAWLRHRVAQAKPGEKLALVLDIDETSLSNWDQEKADDFGYIGSDWDAWEAKKQAPAIGGTLRVFNEARSHGVAVFFITGRGEAQRTATADNLKAAGYKDWAGLALRGPHPKDESTTTYKSGERRKIVDAGYTIILNIGDQLSDLNGRPQAEYSVKLPNPFYLIP
jgi:5'-nucleotidase (lipoprotein e(P4) family)